MQIKHQQTTEKTKYLFLPGHYATSPANSDNAEDEIQDSKEIAQANDCKLNQ